jgi:hypothetical protein
MAIDNDTNKPDEFETVIKNIAFLALFILPPFLFLLGCWNLYLASELGNRDGHSLTVMFENWQDGLDITRQYSHSYLMSMKRISNAVMQLSIALMMLCGAVVMLFSKRGKNRQ